MVASHVEVDVSSWFSGLPTSELMVREVELPLVQFSESPLRNGVVNYRDGWPECLDDCQLFVLLLLACFEHAQRVFV